MPFRERWRFFNDTLMSTCKNHVSNSKIKDIKGCSICGCSWSIHAWTSNVTKIRLFFFFHPFIHFSMCLFTMYLQTIKVRCLLAMIIHKYLCLFLWLQFIAIRWDSTRQLQSLSTFFFKWQPIPSYMQQFNKLVHSATSSLRNITLQNIRRCSYQFIFWKSSCRVDTITVSANKTDGIMDATGTHPLFSLALRSAEWVGGGCAWWRYARRDVQISRSAFGAVETGKYKDDNDSKLLRELCLMAQTMARHSSLKLPKNLKDNSKWADVWVSSEAGKHTEDNDSKLLRERDLKLPKALKDMLGGRNRDERGGSANTWSCRPISVWETGR